MADIIVASSKPWHREEFERIAGDEPNLWLYVSNPNELNVALSTSNPRYLFFLHWNWKVSQEIWQKHECVCFHITNVPYGRGGSPLQNLILRGKTTTQVTALKMIDEMDAGPIYAKRPMSLEGSAEEIYRRAGSLCWEMINWILTHKPVPFPQEGTPIYFERRKPEQSELPSTGNLNTIYDFIRMLDAPTYPLAFLEHGNFRLEFSNAQILNGAIDARVIIHQRDLKE